ncbi:hypothetical protein ABZP36_018101 [Zizania latifolia]
MPMSRYCSNGSSIDAGDDFKHTRLVAYPDHLRRLPSWMEESPIEEMNGIMKFVKEKSNEFKQLSTVSNKKHLFEKEVKPFLLARGSLCTSLVGSDVVKQMHTMNHEITNKFPVYLSWIALMDFLLTRNYSQWRPILENLATERVTVMLDGVTILAEIEAYFFDYGSLLTPPSSKLPEATVYKAECDACFYPPNKQDRTPSVDGKAIVASTIWKVGRLVGCKVCKGLSCNSLEHAEGLALVCALIHGSELEIKKLDVVTDNDANYEIMKEKKMYVSTPALKHPWPSFKLPKSTRRRAYVLVNHQGVIPPFSAGKCLMVAYDNAPNSIKYNKDQDSTGVMAVDIVGPGNQDSPLQDKKAIERMHDV